MIPLGILASSTRAPLPDALMAPTNLVASLVEPSDPYWNNVVSLLHFDGDLTDETGRVWESVGSSSVSTDQSMFGGSSLWSPTTAGLVRAAHSPDLDFGNGDFTIEFFLHPTSVSQYATYVDKRASGSEFSPVLVQRDAGSILFRVAYAPGSWPVSIVATHPWLNVWTHIAFTRSAGVFYAFMNGALVGSVNGGSSSVMSNTSSFNIAASGNNQYGFVGYLDEFRITKGIARYTENFTPPTAPFPNFGP